MCNLAENGFAFHRNEVDAYRVSYEAWNGAGKIKKGGGGRGKKIAGITMVFVF